MKPEQPAPDLKGLDDRYEILGELRGSDGVRAYLGKRRDDGTEVTITIVRAPKDAGGANNALAHFASDVQLLSKISHPNVARVLEGKWLGAETFAEVSERERGASLEEMIARGDTLSPPRIATVLADANAVIEWARDNGIVHRGVTPDAVIFEPGTNRLTLTLSMTPVPLEGVPGAAHDARTIGMLAWVMLTGEPYTGNDPVETLTRLRPDLATRVVDETVAMAGGKSSGSAPDVAAFIAVIATADLLKAGEVEMARVQAGIAEERRVELEKFVEEQRVCAERAAEIERQLAAERTEFERRMADEHATLVSEQQQFAAERGQLEQERLELEERVAASEAQRAELESHRGDLDTEREELAKRRAEIDGRFAEIDQLRAEVARLQAEVDRTWAVVPGDATVAAKPAALESKAATPASSKRTVGTRRRWMTAAGAIATTGLIVALIIGIHEASVSRTAEANGALLAPAAPRVAVTNLPRGGFLAQRAGGTVSPRIGAPFARPVDSVQTQPRPAASDSVRGDSAARAAAAVRRKPVAQPAERRPSGDVIDSTVTRDTVVAGDTTVRRRSRAVRDSSARRDSTRRDTTARRDTSARRDTLIKPRRDTLIKPRPDTLANHRAR